MGKTIRWLPLLLLALLPMAWLGGLNKHFVPKPAEPDALGQAAHLNQQNLHEAGGGFDLPVVWEARTWCNVGDVDAIKTELQYVSAEAPLFLLSVESLAPKPTFPPQTFAVSGKQVLAGFRHVFRLPNPSQPELIGLFLCRDQKKESACLRKVAMPIGWMIGGVAAQAPKVAPGAKETQPQMPDKVIFFQPLLFTPKGVLRAFSQQPEETDYTAITKYVQHDYPEAGAGWEKMQNPARDLARVLSSWPLELDGSSAHAIVFGLDTSTCGK